MESRNATDHHGDGRDRSRHSSRSMKTDSRASSTTKNKSSLSQNILDDDEKILDEDKKTWDKDKKILIEDKKIQDEDENILDEDEEILDEDEKVLDEDEKILDEDEKILDEDEKILDDDEKILDDYEKILNDDEKILDDDDKILDDDEKILDDDDKILDDDEKILDEDEKDTRDERRSKSSGDEKDTRAESSRSKVKSPDPDQDQASDGEARRSSVSFYSDEYENGSHSGRSLSPYSPTRTPSPAPKKEVLATRNSVSPPYKRGGVGRKGVSRPVARRGGQFQPQQQRRGMRSLSKDSSPPGDLDIVTKRMLSSRLLKINELRNALVELQHRTDELQKENRTLKQLQIRQEKALQRYDDTESEISQLLARHSTETHVLRERLRRTQERERAAERRLKHSEDQLNRSQVTIKRLKKLVNQRELGARDELTRRLEEEKARAEDAEQKIKELEHSIQLNNNSFQRFLAAEKKKTVIANEEINALRQQLQRLTNKIKEKERELDVKNIYANRLLARPSLRKESDGSTKLKAPSRNSAKAVQTEDKASTVGFPTPPPPAVVDEQAPDEYLSLKEPQGPPKWDHQKMPEKGAGDNLDERARRQKQFGKKETEVTDSNKRHIYVQEEVHRRNREALAQLKAAEEARRKKEQLLAKMHAIDHQDQDQLDSSGSSTSDHSYPRSTEQKSIFSLTAPEETTSLASGRGSAEGGGRRPNVENAAVTSGLGRRALRNPASNGDLTFGSYAPSFRNPSPRGSSAFPPPSPKEDRDSALESIGVTSPRGEKDKEMDKNKKSNLLHQLFGAAAAAPAGDNLSTSVTMEVLSGSPPANRMRSGRDGVLHVADSKPAVRAIASFDDDIEELTLN